VVEHGDYRKGVARGGGASGSNLLPARAQIAALHAAPKITAYSSVLPRHATVGKRKIGQRCEGSSSRRRRQQRERSSPRFLCCSAGG
jgi:hypothetical protein